MPGSIALADTRLEMDSAYTWQIGVMGSAPGEGPSRRVQISMNGGCGRKTAFGESTPVRAVGRVTFPKPHFPLAYGKLRHLTSTGIYQHPEDGLKPQRTTGDGACPINLETALTYSIEGTVQLSPQKLKRCSLRSGPRHSPSHSMGRS